MLKKKEHNEQTGTPAVVTLHFIEIEFIRHREVLIFCLYLSQTGKTPRAEILRGVAEESFSQIHLCQAEARGCTVYTPRHVYSFTPN